MLKNILFVFGFLTVLTSCGLKELLDIGSGKATGVFSIPNLNCGATSCLSQPANGSSLNLFSVSSADEIAKQSEKIYSHLNDAVIPELNEALYKVEAALSNFGVKTCDDVLNLVNVTDLPMGSGYAFDINENSSLSSPFNGSTSKNFIVRQNGTQVSRIAIGCNGSVRHMYVKTTLNSSEKGELWIRSDSVDSNNKSLEIAIDKDGSKITVNFASSSANKFTLGIIASDYPSPYDANQLISFNIFGQANLGTSSVIAKIYYTTDLNNLPPTVYTLNNSSWDFITAVAHCYSDFASRTIVTNSTCDSLTISAPSLSGVRGDGNILAKPWTINSYKADIQNF